MGASLKSTPHHIHRSGEQQGTAKKLVRFVSGQVAKLRSAEIIELTAV
jgi:hypothetical protein